MIFDLPISPKFKQLAIAAGWSESRIFDPTDWIVQLSSEGFTVNELAVKILQSFGGLKVNLPADGISPYDHTIHFDPLWAVSGEFDRVVELQDRLNFTLFPIGEETGNGSPIWVGANGHYYIGLFFGLNYLGSNFCEAMEELACPTRILLSSVP